MLKKRPFTELYIHIPFCRGKCDYCAFYSEGAMEKDLTEKYLEKLFSQMEKEAENCSALRSIYFGGGTPTLLLPESMEKLFRKLEEVFIFEKDIEISMECNPETLTEEKGRVMKSFINRVSMGIQSFSPFFREKIGRRNRESDVEKTVTEAVNILKNNSISNIGFDLIYLLPGQTLEEWKEDLLKAVSFDIKHLSCYSLTVEANTPLAEKEMEQNENLSADMWEYAGKFLSEKGFPRYEISNYAKKGYHCRHNDNIWKGAAYLGLGPSACSFDGKTRWMESYPLKEYLSGKEAEKDIIGEKERLAEMFIMGLRKVDGWKEKEWKDVSGGKSFEDLWKKEMEKYIRIGLLQKKDDTLSPTVKGLEYWNDLAEAFL